MTQHIKDGDVDDGLELAEEGVSEECSEDGTEVDKERECVVDDGGFIFWEVKLLGQINTEDGFHAVVGEPLTEFIAYNEEHTLGVGQFLQRTFY